MIIELTTFRAWCRICDEAISPTSRQDRKEAMDDEAAHKLIIHEVTERQNGGEDLG